jgi:hypothetical protein
MNNENTNRNGARLNALAALPNIYSSKKYIAFHSIYHIAITCLSIVSMALGWQDGNEQMFMFVWNGFCIFNNLYRLSIKFTLYGNFQRHQYFNHSIPFQLLKNKLFWADMGYFLIVIYANSVLYGQQETLSVILVAWIINLFWLVEVLPQIALLVLMCCSLPLMIAYIHFFARDNPNNGIDDRKIEGLIQDGKITRIQVDESVDQPSCVICMNEYNRNETILKLRCNHVFHEDCIKNWLKIKTDCPICRRVIDDQFEETSPTDNQNHGTYQNPPMYTNATPVPTQATYPQQSYQGGTYVLAGGNSPTGDNNV